MADERELILDEPENIRLQMEETRQSLANKLEALEQKVTSTVENTTNSVTETVEAVKDHVHTTMDSIKEMLDVRAHVHRHPWPMMGGAVPVGFLAGWLLTNKKQKAPAGYPHYAYGEYGGGADLSHGRAPMYARSSYQGNGARMEPEPARPPEKPAKQKESWVSGVTQSLQPEIDKLKGLAIGTLAGLIRDVVADAIPESIKPKVSRFMDDVTHKLGGEPIEGPVLSHFQAHEDDLRRTAERGYASANPSM